MKQWAEKKARFIVASASVSKLLFILWLLNVRDSVAITNDSNLANNFASEKAKPKKDAKKIKNLNASRFLNNCMEIKQRTRLHPIFHFNRPNI